MSTLTEKIEHSSRIERQLIREEIEPGVWMMMEPRPTDWTAVLWRRMDVVRYSKWTPKRRSTCQIFFIFDTVLSFRLFSDISFSISRLLHCFLPSLFLWAASSRLWVADTIGSSLAYSANLQPSCQIVLPPILPAPTPSQLKKPFYFFCSLFACLIQSSKHSICRMLLKIKRVIYSFINYQEVSRYLNSIICETLTYQTNRSNYQTQFIISYLIYV